MDQTDKIDRYLALLRQYAGTLNLISQIALSDIDQKIADAQAFATAIAEGSNETKTIIDIGSGAGLPGIIIAASLSEYTVHLVERRKKRANFLRLVTSQLALTNCLVWDCDVKKVSGFVADYVTALAVGRFRDLYELSCHLHSDTITLISRKGKTYQEEISELEQIISESVYQIHVIPLDAHGRLVTIRLQGGVGCQ